MRVRVVPLLLLLVGLSALGVGDAVIGSDKCPATYAALNYCEKYWSNEIPAEEAVVSPSCPAETDEAGNDVGCKYGNYYFTYSDYFGCERYTNPKTKFQCIARIIAIGPPPVLVLGKCADKYDCKWDKMLKHCAKDKDSKTEIMKPLFETVICSSDPPP